MKLTIKSKKIACKELFAVFDGNKRISNWLNTWERANQLAKLLETKED